MVEAQHRISTNRLADGPEEQTLLERLVEDVKPTMPPRARGLDYLLATPFRYWHARESRFRRAGERPGIFYASEKCRTAVAETAYWRLLFFSRSPGMALPAGTMEHSAFTIPIRVDRLLDLTAQPYSTAASIWSHPTDYGPCQRFADAARAIGGQALRYWSARDPVRGANIALFDPAGFAASAPRIRQSWHFRFDRGVLTAFAAFPSRDRFSFTFADFDLPEPAR